MKSAASLFEMAKTAPVNPVVHIGNDHKKMLEEMNRQLKSYKENANPEVWRSASTADVALALCYSLYFRENAVSLDKLQRFDAIISEARAKYVNLQHAAKAVSRVKQSMAMIHQQAEGRGVFLI